MSLLFFHCFNFLVDHWNKCRFERNSKSKSLFLCVCASVREQVYVVKRMWVCGWVSTCDRVSVSVQMNVFVLVLMCFSHLLASFIGSHAHTQTTHTKTHQQISPSHPLFANQHTHFHTCTLAHVRTHTYTHTQTARMRDLQQCLAEFVSSVLILTPFSMRCCC